MVFNRQWADREYVADLMIALAIPHPLQNLYLAGRDHALYR